MNLLAYKKKRRYDQKRAVMSHIQTYRSKLAKKTDPTQKTHTHTHKLTFLQNFKSKTSNQNGS